MRLGLKCKKVVQEIMNNLSLANMAQKSLVSSVTRRAVATNLNQSNFQLSYRTELASLGSCVKKVALGRATVCFLRSGNSTETALSDFGRSRLLAWKKIIIKILCGTPLTTVTCLADKAIFQVCHNCNKLHCTRLLCS